MVETSFSAMNSTACRQTRPSNIMVNDVAPAQPGGFDHFDQKITTYGNISSGTPRRDMGRPADDRWQLATGGLGIGLWLEDLAAAIHACLEIKVVGTAQFA